MKKYNLKLPVLTFSFKPTTPKIKKTNSYHKSLNKILYAVAKKDDKGEWEAHINTKGIEGYKDITILPFTDKSFELKNRNDVFRVNKDEKGRTVRVIRTDIEAEFYPGSTKTFCTLCENHVFSGYITRVEGVLKFDMSVYQGGIKQCNELITMINKIKKNEKE